MSDKESQVDVGEPLTADLLAAAQAFEAPERAAAIRRSGARILLVAMGVPRQELFVEDHWDSLGVSFAMGVGGPFFIRNMREALGLSHIGINVIWMILGAPLGPGGGLFIET